jgi:uncharacterized cupredoxin-like copper-binding protein
VSNAPGRPSRAPVYVTIGGLAIALILILFAARGSPAPPVVIERAGTDAAPRQVNVILRDYRFLPTPIVLVRGETVRFELINGGLQPHEFVLGDVAVQQAWASAHALATPPGPFATHPPASVAAGTAGLRVMLGSGDSTSVVYRVPHGSELELVCHLPGHVAEGMVGAIVLRDGPR